MELWAQEILKIHKGTVIIYEYELREVKRITDSSALTSAAGTGAQE
jgi:hypothetical protein